MFSLTENNNLFGENIFEYDIYELANWIYRCKYRYVNLKTKVEKDEAEKFISEWLEHRELHKQFYESDTYQEALIASNYKRPTIYARHGKKRVDISELVYPDRLAWTGSLPSLSTANAEEFAEILKNNVAETIDNYFELIEHCFHTAGDYKENIDNILKTFFKESYVVLDLVSLPKNTDISKLTKDEMIDTLKKQVRPKGYYLKKATPKTKRKSYVEQFKEFEISKSTYFDWKNETKEERDYDKKFIVSLGLMLGLPIDEFEKLLNFNGYTVNFSMRQFDDIVRSAVCVGFSFEYVQILIDKANAELEKKHGKSCGKIPQLKRNTKKTK